MLWQVRALLEDRPGSLAAIAETCGRQRVNILGLQIFPAVDGRVVDELVLHTPGGWGAADVEELCERAGVEDATVAACSPHALEDQPVRYVRAAQVVMEEPDLLEDQLCKLLDAVPAGGPQDLPELVLDDEAGPAVRLARRLPFTDTELARATELRRLADLVPGRDRAPALMAPSMAEPTTRPGCAADAGALVAMHDRCSAQTVYRRYHSPMVRLTPRLARSLLEPAGGISMVVTVADDVVAAAVLVEADGATEVGILVEDGWQRQGIGSRLLRAVAEAAADRGVETLTCLVQPDNDAVLRTIRRAGLRVRVSRADGVTVYRIPVRRLRDADGRARRRRPAMGEVTTPLVALLHNRRELREAYPAADLIDQAVRGGA